MSGAVTAKTIVVAKLLTVVVMGIVRRKPICVNKLIKNTSHVTRRGIKVAVNTKNMLVKKSHEISPDDIGVICTVIKVIIKKIVALIL